MSYYPNMFKAGQKRWLVQTNGKTMVIYPLDEHGQTGAEFAAGQIEEVVRDTISAMEGCYWLAKLSGPWIFGRSFTRWRRVADVLNGKSTNTKMKVERICSILYDLGSPLRRFLVCRQGGYTLEPMALEYDRKRDEQDAAHMLLERAMKEERNGKGK
jgi:hypothetical protein